MKLLLKLDSKATAIQIERINVALRELKKRYEGITEVRWTVEWQSYDDVKWVEYWAGAYGLNWGTIIETNRKAWKEHGYKYDHVIHMITPENWKAPGIGGWHTGIFSNLSSEVVKISNSDKWLRAIIDMEILHAMNEWSQILFNRRLGGSLEWDREIVHGEHEAWGKLATQEWEKRATSTAYYTDYDENFDDIRNTFGGEIQEIYEARRKEELKALRLTAISLIHKILAILRGRLQELQKNPHPFLGEEELKVGIQEHKH